MDREVKPDPKSLDGDNGSSDSLIDPTSVGMLVVLIFILIIVVNYAAMRARYDDVYKTYGILDTPQGANLPVNIGPRRIMLGYEYPGLTALLESRPIPQPAAEFLLRLIRTFYIPDSMLLTPIDPSANPLENLKKVISSKENWDDPSNPLGPGGKGQIPYGSHLVSDYAAAKSGSAKDLSLEVLWCFGYEEFVRQRFTTAATSVLQEWDYMFGAIAAAPSTKDDASCATGAVAATVSSRALSMGAMGLMVPEPFGAVAGLVGLAVGGIDGWFSTGHCRA